MPRLALSMRFLEDFLFETSAGILSLLLASRKIPKLTCHPSDGCASQKPPVRRGRFDRSRPGDGRQRHPCQPFEIAFIFHIEKAAQWYRTYLTLRPSQWPTLLPGSLLSSRICGIASCLSVNGECISLAGYQFMVGFVFATSVSCYPGRHFEASDP